MCIYIKSIIKEQTKPKINGVRKQNLVMKVNIVYVKLVIIVSEVPNDNLKSKNCGNNCCSQN